MKKYFYLPFVMWLCIIVNALPQIADPCPTLTATPPSPCDVVTATIFESTDWENDIHALNTVNFIGMPGALSIPTFTAKVTTRLTQGNSSNIGLTSATGRVYAVVDNPYNINTNFPDIQKPMILLPSMQAVATQRAALVQYSVSGLNAGQTYDIVVEGYYMATTGCTTISGTPTLAVWFGIDVNGNPIGQKTFDAAPTSSKPITAVSTTNRVQCFSVATTYKTPTAGFELMIGTDYNGVTGSGTDCRHLYGITKIEIRGKSTTVAATIPKIISSQGSEVCRNELVRFSLDKFYDACTYKWEKSANGTSGWTTVGTSQNYLEEISQAAYYRCTINAGKAGGLGISNIFYLSVIDCCNEADGGSRVTLLHDNFGEFISSSLYKTVDGRIIPTCNGARKIIMDPVPATRPAYGTPNMPGVVFLAAYTYQPSRANCEVRNPGDVAIYAVPDMNTWYSGAAIGNADADGNANGGVLFMDVANNMLGEVYRRQIDNLCEGKRTYFQVDFAPGSSGANTTDILSLNIYARNNDGSKGILLKSTGDRKSDGIRWQTYKLEFDLPAGYSSVYLTIELVKTDWKSAGEFFLDNVKFMVCSQPHIEAYSNVTTLAQDTTICGDAILKFGTKLNDKIKNAYNNAVRFIYQRSTDNKNWENITGIVAEESINLDMSKYSGATNYFRVIAAEDKDLQKFLTNPDAEIFANACRTTSISLPFIVTREGNLNMGSDQTFSECKGRELTLTGTPAASEPQIAQWEWVTASGTVLVPKGNNEANRNIKYTVTGSEIVYFVGYNKNGCAARKKFTINESTKVTITLSETKICGQTTVTATSVPATGVTYAWKYTNGANITSTGSSVILNTPAYANGTISVTGTTTTAGYCASDTVKRSITINEKPQPPTATTPLFYPVEAGNANVSTDANVQYTGSSLYWRNAAGTLLLPPVLQSKSTAGTYNFWVGQISPEGCRSDSIQITVVISSVPAPEVRDTTICAGQSLNLSVLAKATEPTGTLVWYTTLTGAGSPTAPVLPGTAAPNDYYYYVTQKIGADESEKTPIKVTVLASPTLAKPADQTVCNGLPVAAVNFPGGATYSWTNTNTAIGLPATGNGNIAAFNATNSTNAPISGDIEVTPTANGCKGNPVTFTITVNPTPTVDKPLDQTKCKNTATDAVNFTGNIATGVTYSWTNTNIAIGLPATGTGNIAAFNAANSLNAAISGTITVTPVINGCTGSPVSFTITVNPAPTVNKPADQTLCNGATTDAVNFTGNISSGVTYNWTNTNAAIGLAAIGNGDIASFPATNSTNAPIAGTIEVTPTANGCTGAPVSFTITVNPTPTVTKPADQTKCNNTATDAVNFTGNMTSGVTYDWTNTNAAIGLPASGTGNIASFTATNSTNARITATITVTPTANDCPGTSTSFDFIIDPTPTVVKPADQTKCNNATTDAVNFTGNMTSGVTYNWTNNNTAIGLPASGTGNIAAFNTTNTTNAAITGTITVTPTANGCSGTPASFTITINPTPTVNKPADQDVCNGAPITAVNFTGNIPSGVTYNWVNTNPAIGLPATGNGNIAAFNTTNTTNAAISGTITVTPTINGCTGTPESFTITVNPAPMVFKPADQTKCNNATTDAVNFTGNMTSGVTYNWTNTNAAIGLPASGTGDINPFTATNATNAPITGTITVTPTSTSSCPGVSTTFTITVNPTPTVNKPADQTVCNNAATTAVNFTGNIATGVTYNWTNTNTAIGLPASGTGNIASFPATNPTNAPITGTITVTPTINSCSGTSTSFDFTIDPSPTVTKPANQTKCNGAPTDAVNFTGNITGGVTYSWTNNNPAIGLAAFGTGDIASFTATNPTNAPITATITVTPTANGCTGTSTSFDFTIDPTPTVNKPNDQTKCNGSPTDAVNFTGNITGGVTYNWTNDNTDIGLAASGTGNIASFTATNSTNAPITGTITVTPTINSCTGTSISFDFTIDPSPTVTKPANQTKCNGAPTDPVNFAGNITNGVTYNWTNSNPAIGLAASGTGDIAPFTATNSTNARITATITVTPTANNCQGTSTSFDFTIDPSPTVTKPADQTKCNGTATDAINFTGNITGGVTYTWTNSNPDIGLAAGGTGNIAPFTATNTASMQISGIITVTPTFNGCQGTPVSFTIKVTPTPTVIDPPTDGVRCGAGGVTLGAKASAGEIKWYTTQTGGTAVWTGTNYTTPDISATTSYWVEAVDNNCTSLLPRTQVKAIINQKPTVDFDYSEQTICEGNETQVYIINPTPGATFTWVNDATIIEKNSDGSVITVKPPYKKSGNNYQSTYPYTVIVNDGCEQSFTAMVKIDEALHGSIVATLPQICEGISTTINAGSYNAYTYSWTSTALDIVKPESRVTVSPAETTTYMLDMSRGVCTAADAITIDVNSKPVILSIDSVGVRNREIIYEQGTGTPPFKFGVDGVPANDNPVKYDLSFGMHSFYIIDAAGCRSNAADRLVDVPKFFIPPSFSPNGDGVNDRWEIPSMNEIFPDAVITIYDRYGKELTKYSGTDQGWNGTYLGREMPTTDYWYIIDIEEINKQYVGHFTLLRK